MELLYMQYTVIVSLHAYTVIVSSGACMHMLSTYIFPRSSQSQYIACMLRRVVDRAVRYVLQLARWLAEDEACMHARDGDREQGLHWLSSVVLPLLLVPERRNFGYAIDARPLPSDHLLAKR